MGGQRMTPEEFGLKVRSHPDALVVSARNKMGVGEVREFRSNLEKQLIQTSLLAADQRTENLLAAARVVGQCQENGLPPDDVQGGLLFRDVPLAVVRAYLNDVKHTGSPLADPSAMLSYINGRPEELDRWHVFRPESRGKAVKTPQVELGLPLGARTRTVRLSEGVVHFSKGNILDPSDEKGGLDPD